MGHILSFLCLMLFFFFFSPCLKSGDSCFNHYCVSNKLPCWLVLHSVRKRKFPYALRYGYILSSQSLVSPCLKAGVCAHSDHFQQLIPAAIRNLSFSVRFSLVLIVGVLFRHHFAHLLLQYAHAFPAKAERTMECSDAGLRFCDNPVQIACVRILSTLRTGTEFFRVFQCTEFNDFHGLPFPGTDSI